MKKYLLSFVLLIFVLFGCSSQEPSEELKEAVEPISYKMINGNMMKFVSDCDEICYKDNDDYKYVNFNDFDFQKLVAGDAIRISYYGNLLIKAILPGKFTCDNKITNIEVVKGTLYMIKLNKTNDSYSFSFVYENVSNTIKIREVGKYAYTLIDDNINTKSFIDYADGTTFYYVYNEAVLDTLVTCSIYDFNPYEHLI